MLERFTQEARTAVIQAQAHARRLGHRHLGCEHLLLSLSFTPDPAGAVLRAHGVTPGRVEEEIVRRGGLGAGAGLFADLDRDALAWIGVDLDTVRARIEAAFGAEALSEAGRAAQAANGPSARHRLHSRRPHWRRRARRPVPAAPAGPAPAASNQAAGASPTGHLPFTPGAKKALEHSLREAVARQDTSIRTEHVILGLLAVPSGPVPLILAALGTSAPQLGAALRDHYRQAS